MLIASALLVPGCTREKKQSDTAAPSTESRQAASGGGHSALTSGNEVVSKTTLLAVLDPSVNEADHSRFTVIFGQRGNGVAYRFSRNGKFRAVFNGKQSSPYDDVSHLSISPDGKHFAHDLLMGGRRRIALDNKAGKVFDDVWRPVFSPDSRHIAYTARAGRNFFVVVDDRVSKSASSEYSDKLAFNSDSSRIAFIERDFAEHKTRLIISDLDFGHQSRKDVRDDDLITDKGKTKIAAVIVDGGKQRVITFSFDRPDDVAEGPLYDSIDNVGFSRDGASISYLARKNGKNYLVLDGREEQLPKGVELREPPVVRPDGKGAGVILVTPAGWYFHEAFTAQGTDGKKYNEAALLVYSNDGSHYAYCGRDGKRFIVIADGREGPAFDMVIDPVFSPDGSRIVYRARKNGRRFVVVADDHGKVIRQLDKYEMVFPVVFTPDGKSVAYGVKDGNKLVWKVDTL